MKYFPKLQLYIDTFLVMFLLFWCYPEIAAAIQHSKPLTPMTLQLNWKFQYEFAGPIAAIEKGFYKNQGLQISLTEGGPVIDPVQSVVSGQADFGISSSSLLVDRANGKPVVALAALMQQSAVGLLARRASGIESIADLKGKYIALDVDNLDEISAFLAFWGLSGDSYRTTPRHHSIKDLESGRVDAISVYISNELYDIQGHQDEFILFSPQSAGINLFGNLLFTSEKLIDQDLEKVEAFRQATLQGWKYAMEHPEEIAKIIFSQYNSQGKSLDHFLFEAEKLKALTLPDLVEIGYMSPDRWSYVADFYVKQGKIAPDFSIDGFVFQPGQKYIPLWLYVSLTVVTLIGLLFAYLYFYYRKQSLFKLKQTHHQLDSINHQLNLMSALVENLSTPFYVLDITKNWQMVFANQASCDHFGSSLETLMSYRLRDWNSEITDNELNRLLDTLRQEKKSQLLTKHIVLSEGKKRIIPVEIMISYLNVLGHEYAYGYILDITERLKNEKKLITEKEQAELTMQSKSAFLANMSHEIRTPMNGILGLTKLALDETTEPMVWDYLVKICSSAETLLQILNDILDFSKLEAQMMDLKEDTLGLSSLAKDLHVLFDHAAKAKGLAFKIDLVPGTPEWVLCDSLRLKQVMTNLIGNAIKFTDQGVIAVQIKPVTFSDAKACLYFEVSDSGIGISEQEQKNIFRSFAQVDNSATRRFSGTGLGLVISKQLVELMGSQLELVSQPGKGSRFSFKLTVSLTDQVEAELNKPQPVKITTHYLKQKLRELGRPIHYASILLAEDNQVNQQIAVRYLDLAGISVNVVENGQQALEQVRQAKYHAILMDVHMPVMDGIEATRKIRDLPEYADLPIIAVSAGVTFQEQERCLKAGMDDFLTKPIGPEELIEKLIEWIAPTHTEPDMADSKPSSVNEGWHPFENLVSEFDFTAFGNATDYDGNLLDRVLKIFLTQCDQKYDAIVDDLSHLEWQKVFGLLEEFKADLIMLGSLDLLEKTCKLIAEVENTTSTPATFNDWRKCYLNTKALLQDTFAHIESH